MKRLLLAFPLVVLITAARSSEDELMKRAKAMFKPVPDSPIPASIST